MTIHNHGTPFRDTDEGDDGFCDVCRPAIDKIGKDYRLAVGVTKDGKIVEVSMEEPEVNRFDPFEALDKILEAMLRGTMKCANDVDIVAKRLENLRAYITGMEK